MHRSVFQIMGKDHYRFFRKTILLSTFLVMSYALRVLAAHNASKLNTPSFQVQVSVNCEEGNVTCNDVTYVGVNRKTKASIKLRGKTVHSLCKDRVTPCHFLGYEFQNRRYRYFVSEDGRLEIYRGQSLVASEQGIWSNEGFPVLQPD
jgi:hypothetical protein